ncbi:hypothetical protein P152DRAFT_453658 [Eremomyces bilateralis CBS 781.70]|uniref:CFEM domain-containing protein n=1 Tax=Eremomyces bilateralis CBS 781.70 TaxID=1392243 RepID=A0A6G1GGL8_9PEZI|nr:uncharacterized protein P152DRAFT_453658 [Eremomyces bilateralis CBS 781.70]KAF1817051.1 hypothetical protein P152DRAFT_453658 [Eremomyces bilateralis CBS 781.70]
MQLTRLALVLALSLPLASAQTNPLSGISTCAVGCMGTVVPNFCNPTDLSCMCTNEGLAASIQECLTSSCTLIEALETRNATAVLCEEPIRTRPDVLLYLPLNIVAWVLVILRFIARHKSISPRTVGLDDACMAISAVMLVPFTIFCTISRYHGLGMDIWKVTPDDVTLLLRDFYATEVIYPIMSSFIKASFIFFYLRIFPSQRFRIICYGVMTLSFAYGITFSSAYAFQCTPVPFAWTRWDGLHAGTCINVNSMVYAQASINIFLDLLVLGLPLPALFKLELSWARKSLVLSMFSLGFFITGVSCVRLSQVLMFGDTTNPSREWYGLGIWTVIEVDVGIICACLPTMGILLRKIFPGLSRSTQKNSQMTPASMGSRSHDLAPSKGAKGSKGGTGKWDTLNDGGFIELSESMQSLHHANGRPYH